MITRFRVEGWADEKQELIEELSSAATKAIKVLTPKSAKTHDGQWECTADVISRDEDTRNYRGRMTFVYSELVNPRYEEGE